MFGWLDMPGRALLAVAGLLALALTPIPPFNATPQSCATYWSQAPVPGPSQACNALALSSENRGS